MRQAREGWAGYFPSPMSVRLWGNPHSVGSGEIFSPEDRLLLPECSGLISKWFLFPFPPEDLLALLEVKLREVWGAPSTELSGVIHSQAGRCSACRNQSLTPTVLLTRIQMQLPLPVSCDFLCLPVCPSVQISRRQFCPVTSFL